MLLVLGGCATKQQSSGGTRAGAAAPPPAVRVAPGVYYIFFEKESADLLPDARGVIKGAARDAARLRPKRLRITGYADPKGSAEDNKKLSQARAQRVATALIAEGVAPWAVAVVPYGEIADMENSQGERRVRILFE